jgi:hypothetical protein
LGAIACQKLALWFLGHMGPSGFEDVVGIGHGRPVPGCVSRFGHSDGGYSEEDAEHSDHDEQFQQAKTARAHRNLT